MPLPPLPHIDTFSFWVGFAAAALVVLLLYWFRRPIAVAREAISARLKGVREALTSGTERNLREDILRFAQTSHLAGSFFALNEILLPPRLLIPEPPIDPTLPPQDEDVTAVIPIISERPDLAGIYRAPTASVDEVFGGSENVLVLGGPGSGKTTLLAHLVTRAAQDDEALFPGGVTPIFVHAADLQLPRQEEEDVAQPLITAAQARVSALTATRLPNHLRLRLREFKCVLFLDGFDELPPSQVAEVVAWLKEFRKEYPSHRLIAAAGLWGFGPLLNFGFAPVLIAPWNADDYRALIQKWAALWEQIIRARKKRAAPGDLDPQVIAGWLNNGNQGRTIFELTLKIWAAFLGDTRGNRPVDWLEAYVLRHGVKPTGQRALGKVAAWMLGQEDSLGKPRAETVALCDTTLVGPSGRAEIDSDDFLDGLIGKRLLVKHAKDRVSFQHSLAAAYCAATGLALDPQNITPSTSPLWVRTLYFFASLGDLTPVVGRFLTQAPDVLQTELLACALWLRDAPATAKWRNEVFRRLAKLMLDTSQPESLRVRALTGFAASYDTAVAALFKQSLANPDPFNRRLATLGLGIVGDATVVPQMAALFADPYLDVRWAAALALAAIGMEPAIDALVQGMLQGDDTLRQACAQALARQPETGHPLLKEAIAHQDIGVRRAAVYGLADTRADWAMELLQKVQVNEQQWIVRNAAVDKLEKLKVPADHRPKPYVAPESQGWLIAWAASKGTGVPPGKAAIEVLNRALKEGDEATRRAAAQALGHLGDPLAARELYAMLRDPVPLMRDAAFRALVQVATATGQKLAAPVA